MVGVEGNGGVPAEIVSVSVLDVPVSGGGPVLRSWLVRPETVILPAATAVHGIDNGAVRRAPLWHGVAREVEPVLTGRVVVVHDAPTSYRMLAEHLPAWRPVVVLDTLLLAQRLRRGLPDYSLRALVAEFGLAGDGLLPQHGGGVGRGALAVGWLMVELLRDESLDWDGVVGLAAVAPFEPVASCGAAGR
ncbi:hypothetical protein ACFV4N_23680 [Actinosynnema sp. NPDC059797]